VANQVGAAPQLIIQSMNSAGTEYRVIPVDALSVLNELSRPARAAAEELFHVSFYSRSTAFRRTAMTSR
jgi:hypothetical protein